MAVGMLDEGIRLSAGARVVAFALAFHPAGCAVAGAGDRLNCGVATRHDRAEVVTARLGGVPAIPRVPEQVSKPPVALLLIHGTDDRTVSPTATADLYRALRPYYLRDGAAARLHLSLVPGLSHTWGAHGTDTHIARAIAGGFNRFLAKRDAT